MKRQKTLTLRSFFSPAITPVIPAQSQENVNINLQQTAESGASIDAPIVDTPIVNASIVDAPMVDAPTVDGDAPSVDAPNVDAPTENNVNDPNETLATNEELTFNSSEIVADPRFRKPIEKYGINIRDAVRREYLIREYLGRLTVILALVRFLLLQALAFCGHDESRTSSNKRNFLELTDWLKMRDECVKNLLDNAPENNLLTSPYVQKDMCEACAKQTTKAILDDIGDKNFSILVDESRDASIKEQMAVVLSGTKGSKGHVIEIFLGVEHVPDTTSAALKAALDAMLLGHGLSIHNVRGQGYDGASNTRGEFHGLQRLVLDENPYAFYIHCFAHQLQLVVVSVAKCCCSVTDFFNYTTLIVNTVNASCKRHDQLAQKHHENVVRGLENDEIFSERGKNQETNLARPEDTRWGSHHKTLCRLQLMWQAVLEVLENICDDGPTSATKTCAAGLLKHMESFEFVLIMHLMIKLLGKTNDLSQCLQKKNTNIVRAVSLIGVTLQKMNDLREHGWKGVFEATKQFYVKHHIIVPDMSETTVVARGRSRGRGGQLLLLLSLGLQQLMKKMPLRNDIFTLSP
ncbi:hypothetical protein U9M48_043943 [Paspalum notatum var. saurae]|uniref:DUF4371 domain-containing protein n=1 Tax=Paspalum notatum var. saurae TaxID=547442 RepID=A0AAQ3UVY2_PASNO